MRSLPRNVWTCLIDASRGSSAKHQVKQTEPRIEELFNI